MQGHEETGEPALGARRLRRCGTDVRGLRRRRDGDGFHYVLPDGRPLEDDRVLERIDDLTIPPAWEDVWICPWPNGHLQAVGTDAAGRRQYLYHERWRSRRDEEKFRRMERFAAALPRVRRRVGEALEAPGLGPERVLAAAVRMLDRAFLRSGGDEYAERNGSFGLATLLREHVTVHRGGVVELAFTGKAGVVHNRRVVDADVARVLLALKRRRGGGQELLAYRRRNGAWVDVRAGDVNDYLKELAGEDFTAKDFRTWYATVLTAVALAMSLPALRSESGAKRAIARAVKEAADYLGNTPAVCRKAYVDPRVIDRYRDGQTILADLDAIGGAASPRETEAWQRIEAAVLDLLADGGHPLGKGLAGVMQTDGRAGRRPEAAGSGSRRSRAA
jgi:DNA topoisomerase IB